MVGARISTPDAEMLADVRAQLEAGQRTTAQFHESRVDPAVLELLNELCAQFGALLEVRFYGWYDLKGAFDAALLRHLPDVRRLTLNCLESMENATAIAELPHLEEFHLGVLDQPDAAFLD